MHGMELCLKNFHQNTFHIQGALAKLYLDRVLVFQVQPRDLQVSLQLVDRALNSTPLSGETISQDRSRTKISIPTKLVVSAWSLEVDAVLLLPGLERDPHQHLGGLAPVLLPLVDIGQVLSNSHHLVKKS